MCKKSENQKKKIRGSSSQSTKIRYIYAYVVKETYGRMSDARKTDGTGGSELRDTLEGTGHGKRRKSGTYNAG